MKKLFKRLLLGGAMSLFALSANAAMYITGNNVDGASWSMVQMTQQSDGTYTWEGSVLGSGFKFTDSTSWNGTYNLGGSSALTLGQEYSLTNSGSSGNIPLSNTSQIVKSPKVVLNPSTLKVTVTGTLETLSDTKFEDYIYLVGNLTGWAMEDTYAIPKSEDKIYKGTIKLPQLSDNYFRIYTSVEYGMGYYSYSPSTSDSNTQINSSNTFSGNIVKSTMGCWYLDGWTGGLLEVEANFNTMKITFNMTEGTVYPEEMWIPGNFNNWTEKAEGYELKATETQGTYTGTFYVPAIIEEEGDYKGEYPQFKAYDGWSWIGSAESTTSGSGNFAVELESGVAKVLTTSTDNDAANWYLNNWEGGDVTFTYNYDENTLTLLYSAAPNPEDYTYYLVGINVDGASWTFNDENVLTWDEDLQAYVWEGETLYPEFKITNQDDWTGAFEFGSNGESVDLGVAYLYNTNAENSVGNFELNLTDQYLVNPKVVLSIENQSLTVTGTATDIPFELPEQMWLVGPFNGWDLENQEYVLEADEAEEGIYSGTFKLDETVEYEGNQVNAAEFKIAYGTDDSWQETFGNETDVALTMYKGSTTSTNFVWRGGENWKIENWTGGNITITLDYNEGIVTINTPDQPEFDSSESPELLYLVGNFNDWTGSDADYKLVTEDGVIYTGTFEFQGGLVYEENGKEQENVVAFKIYNTSWEDSYGAYASKSLPVDVEANKALSLNMVQGDGTPNWLIQGWVETGNIDFEVDLMNMTVTLNSSQSAVDKLNSAVQGSDVIFNLQGVRVNKNNLRPGIYIVNGKKVVIR